MVLRGSRLQIRLNKNKLPFNKQRYQHTLVLLSTIYQFANNLKTKLKPNDRHKNSEIQNQDLNIAKLNTKENFEKMVLFYVMSSLPIELILLSSFDIN